MGYGLLQKLLCSAYGILHHMPAKLLYRQKFILKYRLYYGLADGTCVVRYDNETGKGDHRHEGDREESYAFTDVETLVADFLADIARVRRGGA
jgi:Family of unknown function (DUF6516)